MRIRTATPADLDAVADLETVCFPPAEAAGRDAVAARLTAYPDRVWLGLDEEDGHGGRSLLACINGMRTSVPDLTDEMFSHAELHEPDGSWQMIFSVMTSPERRGEGLAGRLLEHVIAVSRADECRGLVLTAKAGLLGFYARYGFVDEGVCASDHGGAVWHQMRLAL
mgnify:FL=1